MSTEQLTHKWADRCPSKAELAAWNTNVSACVPIGHQTVRRFIPPSAYGGKPATPNNIGGVVSWMFICEPPASFARRQAPRGAQAGPFAIPMADPACWDEPILAYLRQNSAQPVLLVRAVNAVVKTRRHFSTRHRDRMRVEILRAFGNLICQGRVARIKRRFVGCL